MGRCRHCGGNVQGYYDGIKLTLLCEDCVESDYRVCCKSSALSYVPERYLDRLDYKAVANPHYKSAAPMRLYLVPELEKLADIVADEEDEIQRQLAAVKAAKEREKQLEKRKVQEEKDRKRNEKLQKEVATRKARLKELNTVFVPADLKEAVFGDYFTAIKNKKHKVDVVRALQRVTLVARAADEMHLRDRSALLYFLLRRWDDLKSKSPEQLKKCFKESQATMMCAFNVEAARISFFLSPLDFPHAVAAIPCLANERQLGGAREGPLSKLKYCLHELEVLEDVAKELVTDRAVKDRFNDYVQYGLDPEEVAAKLKEFHDTRSDPAVRRQMLETEFHAWDITPQSDSASVTAYVNGTKDIDAAEVSAKQWLKEQQLAISRGVYGEYRVAVEHRLMANRHELERRCC